MTFAKEIERILSNGSSRLEIHLDNSDVIKVDKFVSFENDILTVANERQDLSKQYGIDNHTAASVDTYLINIDHIVFISTN